jgi:hypothetical protein
MDSTRRKGNPMKKTVEEKNKKLVLEASTHSYRELCQSSPNDYPEV